MNKLLSLMLFAACSSMAAQQVVGANSVQLAKVSDSGASSRVTINLSKVTLEVALSRLAKESRIPLFYDPAVVPVRKVINVNLENVTVSEALAQILRGTDIVAVWQGGRVSLVRQQQGSAKQGVSQGVITGRITEAKSGKGISGANVSLGSSGRGVVTDENGSYRLAGVAAGSHAVVIRLVGYARQSRVVVVGEGATVTADFVLEPSANVLDQVIVTGTVVQSELKSVPNAITVITAKQIEERGIVRIDQLFRGEVPGLFAQNLGSFSATDSVVMFSRGATALTTESSGARDGTNPIKTYVDGVELTSASFISQIDPRSIERIEILTGPQASTIYGSNALNGVIQIFTKRGSTPRPQVTLNMLSGFVQNDFTSRLAPVHNYTGQLSGTEGRVSYNVGGAWDYIGSWTPSKLTSRTGSYGGGRMVAAALSIDLSARNTLTRNLKRGVAAEGNNDRRYNGEFIPTAITISGDNNPATASVLGRTLGATIGYSPLHWLSNEVVIGNDKLDKEQLWNTYGNFFPADTLLFYQQVQGGRTSERYTSTLQIPIMDVSRLTVTLGADHWRVTSVTTQASATPALTGTLGIPSVTRERPGSNTGGFLQSQMAFSDNLFLTYGIRAEWNPNYGDKAQPNLAPRYGVAYTRELGVMTAKLRASYGRSTRPPTASLKLSGSPQTSSTTIAQYGQFNSQLANEDLGPEFQQGGEGGIEIYFANRASLVVTRYNQTVDELITRVSPVDSVRSLAPNPSGISAGSSLDAQGYGYRYQGRYLNVGSIRNQGWELQGNLNIGALSTKGVYSWSKSRILGITPRYRALLSGSSFEIGRPFDFAPEHTWSLGFTYGQPRTTVSLNINGTGFLYRSTDNLYYSVVRPSLSRITVDKVRQDLPGNYRSVGAGYAMADLVASHRFSGMMDGLLQVQNLADFYRNDRLAEYPTMGRQTKAGLRIKF